MECPQNTNEILDQIVMLENSLLFSLSDLYCMTQSYTSQNF